MVLPSFEILTEQFFVAVSMFNISANFLILKGKDTSIYFYKKKHPTFCVGCLRELKINNYYSRTIGMPK